MVEWDRSHVPNWWGTLAIIMLDDIAQVVKEHDQFGIVAHLGPEADAIGALLGVHHILQQLGKTTYPVLRDEVPPELRFLPEAPLITAPDTVSHDAIDAWIVVDCGQLNRVGHDLEPHIREHPLVVNIDHHADNPHFGDVNWVDVRASTTMLIYDLAGHLGVDVTPDLATCLYSGIIADTDSFRNDNVTADVLRVASELVDHGARVRQVNINLYERRTPAAMRILGYTLAHAQIDRDHRLIWYALSQDEFRATGASVNDTERVVEELRATDGVDVAILLKEMENGRVKVSLRAKNGADVSRVAREFGGGGHPKAAGCLVDASLAEAECQLLSAVRHALAHHGA